MKNENIVRTTIRTLESFSFYRRIDYMHNDIDGTIIYIEKDKYYVKERLNYIINRIAKLYLTTYKTYRNIVKEKFEFSYKIPLVLSNNMIYFFTKGYRSYDNIAINYNNIKKITYLVDGFNIIFLSSNNLYIKKSSKSFYNVITNINKIKDYISIIDY